MSPTKNPIIVLGAYRRRQRERRLEQLGLAPPTWGIEYYPIIRLRLV